MGLSLKYGSEDLDTTTKRLNLAIVLSVDYISYAILGAGNKIVKSDLITYDNKGLDFEPVDKVLAGQGLYTADFNKVNIGIDTNEYHYVPTAEYEAEKAPIYLSGFSNNSIINNKVLSDDMDDITNVYYAPRKLLNSLASKYDNPHIFHAESALLYGSKVSIQTGVIAHYIHNRLNVSVYKSGQFIFSRTYNVDSDLAALYYISSAYDVADLFMDSMPLYLAGDFTTDGPKYGLLSTYIKNITFMRCPVRFDSGEHSPHLYYQLYCLSKCG